MDVEPEFIELKSALATLGMSREQLIWMGILIGTDFDEGVKGIGPKKAYKIVKECNSIEEATKAAGAEEQLELFKAVEAFFLHPPVAQKAHVQFSKMDKAGLVEFLCKKHDFSEERVVRTVDGAEKKMKETGAQTKLGSW